MQYFVGISSQSIDYTYYFSSCTHVKYLLVVYLKLIYETSRTSYRNSVHRPLFDVVLYNILNYIKHRVIILLVVDTL